MAEQRNALLKIWETAEQIKPDKFAQPIVTFIEILAVVQEVCRSAPKSEETREWMLFFFEKGEDELKQWLDNFYPFYNESVDNRQILCLYLKRLVSGQLVNDGHISKPGADGKIADGTDAWALTYNRLQQVVS